MGSSSVVKMSSFHDYTCISILFSPLVSYIRQSVNRSCFNLDKINLVVLQGITCLKQIVGCHSNTGTVLKLWSMCFDKTCKIYVLLGYHERERKKRGNKEREKERGDQNKWFFFIFLGINDHVSKMNKLLHALLCCYFLHFNDPSLCLSWMFKLASKLIHKEILILCWQNNLTQRIGSFQVQRICRSQSHQPIEWVCSESKSTNNVRIYYYTKLPLSFCWFL